MELFITLILVMVGTGAILPWPARTQLIFQCGYASAAWTSKTVWVTAP